MVFEEQEIFKGAMQRHLIGLYGHLIELCEVKRGFVNTAVLVRELLLEVVQRSAALRRELADVVGRHTQEATQLRPLRVPC